LREPETEGYWVYHLEICTSIMLRPDRTRRTKKGVKDDDASSGSGIRYGGGEKDEGEIKMEAFGRCI
jgi:hypothetical protein